MRVLPFKPTSAGYSVQPDSGVLSVKLDGGASRLEVNSQGNVGIVNVSWVLDSFDYSLLQAFHRIFIRSLEPFYADLIIDTGSVDRYESTFIPDSLRLVSKNGPLYMVSAQLEVTPLDKYLDEETDVLAQYFDLVMEYGGLRNFLRMNNLLERLVNVEWPDA